MLKVKPVRREHRAMPDDLSEVLRDAPPSAWVALSFDRTHILGVGKSASAAALQAQLRLKKDGEKDHFVLVKMPAEDEGMAAGVI